MEKQPVINDPKHRIAIAKAIGVSTQAISNWNQRGVPIEHCAAIEKATKGAVTRKDLRPNDWQAIWPELVKKQKVPNA